ncbi:hypothetical protein [Streptomyces luteireticuli]|uniref:Minor capsid protein n=1 Tax=Streptomyces luteireticuli TaxID=173858 RepID=A0ABN0Z0K2_9ACTN
MKILRTLADGHRRRQATLLRVLRNEYLREWDRYRSTAPGPRADRAWDAVVARMVHRYGTASAELAAAYYDEARHAAGVPGRFDVPVADPPPNGQVTASRAAVRRTSAPRPAEDDAGQWNRTLRDREIGAVQRLAAQAGRRTIEQAARADPQAVGWVRVIGPNCCAFCALLAVRGLVYADRTSATRTGTGDPYHDRCHCSAEPVFRGRSSDPEPHVAEWEDLYYEASRDVWGDDKRRAFRRAFDAKYRA